MEEYLIYDTGGDVDDDGDGEEDLGRGPKRTLMM